ncbi:phosphate ABC transporter ATP-binding protein [Rummeliibacillus sp. G93]|uniref:ABC transporter ATP-binding protein n=1 Tax=Rummeliibacillus sp. G93 TaxID=2939494 RepID=UPI00201C768C|nr:phosphate ABC transporter ATP-binding protein [Rummeliibacillus sp. G93]UQW97017.1 phosphate ABC transporter ATP-binding protein [Rummeliibacillus sp. G93]
MNSIEPSAIHFKHIEYETGEQHILRNITGSISAGKITALVGPSGAGKTTLLRLCNGLISPTAGEIFIDQAPIASIDPISLRRRAGMALQSAPMLNGTVFENLALPRQLQNRSLDKKEAIKLLDDVGLKPENLKKSIRELSGGQRQRVSLARTLVNRPSILLLDEITSALDPSSIKEVETLIKRLNEKDQTTIIWITHNLEQAVRMGHYAWVMAEGKLIEAGESSLLKNPNEEITKRFIKGELV